jgi:hypothetical protein
MAWPVPSGRGSCGNAIVPGGPAFVYPPTVSRLDTGSRGKYREASDLPFPKRRRVKQG